MTVMTATMTKALTNDCPNLWAWLSLLSLRNTVYELVSASVVSFLDASVVMNTRAQADNTMVIKTSRQRKGRGKHKGKEMSKEKEGYVESYCIHTIPICQRSYPVVGWY